MPITQYEIDQRANFKVLNFPGNHEIEAINAIIDDRLKTRAAKNLGIHLSNERLNFEMKIFADRAN